jgi:hypothetical protein
MGEHRGLLANHRIALEWMMYPPCGRTRVPIALSSDNDSIFSHRNRLARS